MMWFAAPCLLQQRLGQELVGGILDVRYESKYFRFITQDYQTRAVESLVRVFDGQPRLNPLQRVVGRRGMFEGYAFANRKLQIDDNTIYKNVQSDTALQGEGGIKPAKTYGGRQFSIEIEAGTGKTFVYTKSIFELNEKYDLSKIITMNIRIIPDKCYFLQVIKITP